MSVPKRWSISTDGGTGWTVVTPTNGANLRLQQARDLGKGQIFFRRKLNGNPKLKGDDYNLLYPYERARSRRCNELLIRLETKCGPSYREAWRGRFSAGSCAWDLDNCTVEIKPDTVDRYTCLLDAMRIKRNILQVGVVDASAVISASIEVAGLYTKPITTMVTSATFDPRLGEANGAYANGSVPVPSDWWGGTTFQPGLVTLGGFPIDLMTVYWRERIATECVAGNPVPPPGAGWVLLENNCATTGTAVYVREPTFAWPYGTPSQGTCDGDNAIPPAGPCEVGWANMFPCGLFAYLDGFPTDPIDPSLPIPPYFVCLISGTPTALPRARRVEEVAEYLIAESGCDLPGIRSDFYEWLPPGDAPGFTSGINYVTGLANQQNELVILQKSDAIDPTATNPATIGEMTLEEFLSILRVMHQCYWRIDDAGYVRIEHWTYWAAQAGLDITAQDYVIEPLKYDHLSDEIPRIERAVWMEALSRDFVGKDIVYSGPCVRVVNGDGVEEYSAGRITTDISFVLADPDAISKDGFVILATVLDSGVYSTIIDYGAITGNASTNAPLSWANLQRDFWTWNRYLPFGSMNGQDVAFDGYMPNIEQKEVSIPLCCALYAFDPALYLTTALGTRIGAPKGIVETAEHDLSTDRTTFVVRYAY